MAALTVISVWFALSFLATATFMLLVQRAEENRRVPARVRFSRR